MPDLDAIVFVAEPPSFRIEDGLVFISQNIGQIHFERVMRLNTLLHSIQLAKEAVSEYASSGSAEVIPFPKRAH